MRHFPWHFYEDPADNVLSELMGRVLGQSAVDLADDAACLLHLMGNRFTCPEASERLQEAQRYAVAFRCRGEAA